MIHTTTRVLERTSYNLDLYSITLFLNQTARFAVPLFFVISGFVLEHTNNSIQENLATNCKDELNADMSSSLKGKPRTSVRGGCHKTDLNFWQFIKKRLSKIVIPYIFWSTIYYYFVYPSNNNSFISALFTGNASYQLYFIPSLCIFYFLFPILHKFYKFITLPIIVIIFTMIELTFLHHDYFVKNLPLIESLRISVLGLFFFISGMILSKHHETIIVFANKWRTYIALVTAFFAYYLFDQGLSQYKLTYNINAFYSSWRPSVLVYTYLSGVFLTSYFKSTNFTGLAKLSFFVFFIHIIVLEIVWAYIGKFVNPNLYFDLIFFILVTAISFILAKLTHAIPHISKVTG